MAATGRSGGGRATVLRDASTGAVVAEATSEGIDFAAALRHARENGGPALRAMTFHERAAMLRALGKRLLDFKPEFYALSHATGATKGDSWIDIDGGIGTMLVFASKGARELPDGHVYLDGGVEPLSKGGSFVGQHVCVPLEGAAVHINAFNFPVWGMLEKLAPALLAGVPAIVKPATATSYLTELVVRRIVETGILPAGALQLICGGVGDLFDHLGCQDVVSFTGSAATAAKLAHAPGRRASRRALRRRNGLAQFLDPRTGCGSGDAGVRAVRPGSRARDDGQGRPEVHRDPQGDRAEAPGSARSSSALQAKLAETVVGDPRTPGVGMGPLASLAQRDEVLARLAELERESERVAGDPERFEVTRRRPRARALSCRRSCCCAATARRRAPSTLSRPLDRCPRSSAMTASRMRLRSRAAATAASRARCSRPTTKSRRASCWDSRHSTGACWS